MWVSLFLFCFPFGLLQVDFFILGGGGGGSGGAPVEMVDRLPLLFR